MLKLINIQKDNEHIIFNIFGIKIALNTKLAKNYIYTVDESGKKKRVRSIKGIKINFRSTNSTVIIHKPAIKFTNCNFMLREDCHVEIGSKLDSAAEGMQNVRLYLYGPNSEITIGRGFFNANSLYQIGKNSSVIIGDDCMFSTDIRLMTSDFHKIINKNSGEIISDKPCNLVIGNHVWVGQGATILKNASIPSNSIVGAKSVVARRFIEESSVIAGNPANVVKNNIEWMKEV